MELDCFISGDSLVEGETAPESEWFCGVGPRRPNVFGRERTRELLENKRHLKMVRSMISALGGGSQRGSAVLEAESRWGVYFSGVTGFSCCGG